MNIKQTDIKILIDNFEKKYNAKVVYVTQYGSKLYGTDNPNSDTDYKGIFIPTLNDVLLKKDLEHFNFNSNDDNSKNSKEDIDLQLFSVYKFFNLLKKGETGAMDILFSMFREDTQIYNNKDFTTIIMKNYKKFYNRNLHSFIGYCVGQSKVYNVRGERFNELHIFVNKFNDLVHTQGDKKLETMFPLIDEMFFEHPYKYINYVIADISRGSGVAKKGKYVEVLGKKFLGTVSIKYFSEKITEMENQFGNRARASAKGVDFKALSHAIRVINEIEELIDHEFISFPLKNRLYVTSIKEGNERLEDVMDYLDNQLNIVQKKLENSNLAEKSDEAFIDALLLKLITGKLL